MIGDMVSIMALHGIFIIILGITQFALSFWAIIEIVTFDKKYKSVLEFIFFTVKKCKFRK